MNRMDFEVMPCVPDGIWLTVTDAEIDTAAPDVLAALWQMYSFLLDHGLTCDADCDAPSPALCRRRLERIAALLASSGKEPVATGVSESVRSFCLSCARLDALQPAELAILADRHFRLYAAAASSASTSPADMLALLHLRSTACRAWPPVMKSLTSRTRPRSASGSSAHRPQAPSPRRQPTFCSTSISRSHACGGRSSLPLPDGRRINSSAKTFSK